jgi:hypothetical protein
MSIAFGSTSARRNSRDPALRRCRRLDTYDAIVAVGMHAKTGSTCPHTVTIGMGLSMNGHAITETEIVAYSWGASASW